MDSEHDAMTADVHPLAGDVTRALSGLVFPADRRELLFVARENEAPRTLMSLFAALPHRRFISPEDVVDAVERHALPEPGPSR